MWRSAGTTLAAERHAKLPGSAHHHLRLVLSVSAVLAVVAGLAAVPGARGEQAQQCPALLDAYLAAHSREAAPYRADDEAQMVYFLHVPRTAGRTFHSCFLKMGTLPSRRCPKAYDHLRLNMSVPNCHLLSSHDDFSVVSMLPDNVAVLTHLRDPVDRFLSAYEFAVEVGSRSLTRPPTFRKRTDRIATDDVWPWSYLVPFFAEDIRARVAKVRQEPQPHSGHWIHVKHPDGDEYYYNKVLGQSKWKLTPEEQALVLPPLDPYNNPLVMPLAEFVQHPIAQQLLHNGQLFQVLGVTNYSHWEHADTMRDCYWQSPEVQERLLGVATARVKRFLHVGVTDRLSDSVAAAGAALGYSMAGPAFGGSDDDTAPDPARRARLAARGHLPQSDGDEYGEDPHAAHMADEDIGSGGSGRPYHQRVAAGDLPDLADKVRAARLELQSAQRELFRASQFHTADTEVERLKAEVAHLREHLHDVQEQLLIARAQLPTSSDPVTDSKRHADQMAAAASNARRLPAPLGVEFQKCAARAQARNLQRRDNSLLSLAMPDGRYVMFSREARKKIPEAVIQEIRELNRADVALHELGTRLLDANLEAWKADGRFHPLPDAPAHILGVAKGGGIRSKWNIPKPRPDGAHGDTYEEL